MSLTLEGKTALVTGGTRGIGKAIVEYLAELGADVALTYARSADAAESIKNELETSGTKVKIFQADAADFDSANEVISSVVDDWSKLDILVNNAGITKDNLLLRMSEEQWDDVLEVNLKSIFNYSKAVARPMMKNRGGSIINISSVVGISGNAGQANYSASKAGIIGFSKSMAKELASRNIRTNVVAPGYITTEMTDELDDSVIEMIENETPMGRAGDPEDVARLVAFLASDLSSYITGEVIRVDGGMAM